MAIIKYVTGANLARAFNKIIAALGTKADKGMIVTITRSGSDFTADKTYAEIVAAHNAGLSVTATCNNMICYLSDVNPYAVSFASGMDYGNMCMSISSADEVWADDVTFLSNTHNSSASAHSGLFDKKIDKAGDTMTGSLFLAADPAYDLEAATKQYVDANKGVTAEATTTAAGLMSAADKAKMDGLYFTEYTELDQLGLTKGEETIESIGRALPNQSRLVTQVNNKNNTAIYPFNHGTLRVTRLNQWRIFYEFIRDDDTEAGVVMGIWYMTAGITGVTFSNGPWYAIYGEHNKPTASSLGITPANIGAAAASHNQAASTITAGTFAGQVVAKSSAQTPGTSLLRNSKVLSTKTNPSNNGEINWQYA